MKQIIFFYISLFSLTAKAQDFSHIFFKNNDAHSIFFSQNDSILSDPIILLNSNAILKLEFDELEVDNSRNLYYQFIHCNHLWQPSDLLDMDFCSEFNKFYDSDKATFSFNTTASFVHYTLNIDTSPLKISGNYLLRVFDANSDELIISQPFWVYEKKQIDVLYNVKMNDDKQNISVLVNPITLKIKTSTDITIAIFKNHDFFDYKIINDLSRIIGNKFIYDNISFPAGNEFRWFDNSDLKRNGTHIHDVLFEDPFYHITLNIDEQNPRTYKYHGDMNGRHYIITKNSTYDPSIAADYTIVHFTLKSENIGDVYIAGDLTENTFSNYNKMNYDPLSHCYHQSIWVKQGIHNYYYKSENNIIERNFSDTENVYNLLIYYHPFGSRYDRLIYYNYLKSQGHQDFF